MSESFKKDYTLFVARTIANTASMYIREASHATLLKFAHQEIRRYLGMSWREITTVEFVQDARGYVSPILFGTENMDIPAQLGRSPIVGATTPQTTSIYSSFGFYMIRDIPFAPAFALNPGEVIHNLNYEWEMGGKRFSAKYVSKVLNQKIEDYSPKLTSIDYASLWKDGTLSGAVLVGDNLKAYSSELLHEYKSFYVSQGYRFSKADDLEIPNIYQYLKDQISGGKLDYLVKEAHSDGDDNNLLRLVRAATLHIGRKQLSNGKMEQVTLIENNLKTAETDLLPNKDFGAWIRNRETNGSGQFVYFNTSCGSANKVSSEISASHSPLFLPIGGSSMMNTFLNDPASVLRRIIEGVLKQEDFPTIRKAIEVLPEYVAGSDRFAFVDSPEFETHIRSRITVPTENILEIFDAAGKPFQIDNAPVRQ